MKAISCSRVSALYSSLALEVGVWEALLKELFSVSVFCRQQPVVPISLVKQTSVKRKGDVRVFLPDSLSGCPDLSQWMLW